MWRGVEFWPFPLTCFVAFKTLSHYRASVWCSILRRFHNIMASSFFVNLNLTSLYTCVNDIMFLLAKFSRVTAVIKWCHMLWLIQVTVRKLVNAKYCNKFVHVIWKDGRVMHVNVTQELYRSYRERLDILNDAILRRWAFNLISTHQVATPARVDSTTTVWTVVHTVLTATSQSNGNGQTSTPHRIQTP